MNKNQKLTIMLSMTMALGSVSNTFAAGIKDVDVERVFGKDNKINVLKNKNFVQGFENGDLKLDQGIKRSEITKLLAYANGQEELAKKLEKIQGTYKDVEITYWANGVINAASQNPVETNGLFMIKGYPDGTFMPEKDITYAELAKMLVVLADDKLTEEDVKAADLNWPSEWIAKAKELGIFEDITFAEVNQVVNREDAFTMFYNALAKEEVKSPIEEKKEDKIEVKERTTKKRRKSSSSSNSNVEKPEEKPSKPEEKPEEPKEPEETKAKEELKNKFIEAAKAQKSETPELYSLNFDGTNANITFKESGLGENPVDVVQKAAQEMIGKMLTVAEEVEVTVGEKSVVVKDNSNIVELAKLFLGNTTPEDFIKTGKLDQDFSIKISKGEVKDVEIDGLKANFTVDKDVTKAKEELKKSFIEAAKKQESINEKLYSLNFDGTNANITFKESGLGDNPVDVVQKAAQEMIAKMLEVADKVEVTVGEKSVIVAKDNSNIVELARLFLGETTPEDFIKTGELNQNFSIKISKGEVKDVKIDGLKANFTVEKDITKAKEELKNNFIEEAKKQKSINEKLYSLNFDGTNANITFKESGLGDNPVDVVQKAAQEMIAKMLEVADEVEVIVGEKSVIVAKDNLNIVELAKLFLGNTTPDKFIETGELNQDFSIKISKGEVKDVEIDGLKASFTVEKDVTNAKEELKKDFIEAAKAQKSETPELYSLNFDGTNANITFKESGLGDNPVDVVQKAAQEMIAKMLTVADEVEVTVGGESVVVKDNSNIVKLAELFLGETKPDKFIETGELNQNFSIKISKGEVKDVKIDGLKASFTVEKDVEKYNKTVKEINDQIGSAITTINGQRKIFLEKTEDQNYQIKFVLEKKKGQRFYSGEDIIATKNSTLFTVSNGAGIKYVKDNQFRKINNYIEEVEYNGKSFKDILNMKIPSTVGEAMDVEHVINVKLKEEYSGKTLSYKIICILNSSN